MDSYREKVALNISFKLRLIILVKLQAKLFDSPFTVSLRRYKGGWPSATQDTEPEKAVDFQPVQWRHLMDLTDFIDWAVKENQTVRRHLGFNLYVITSEKFVVFREFRKNHFTQKLQSTGMNIAINHEQWHRLKDLIESVANTHFPEVTAVNLCNHFNQDSFFGCPCCNPEGRMADWYGDYTATCNYNPPAKKVKAASDTQGVDEPDSFKNYQ